MSSSPRDSAPRAGRAAEFVRAGFALGLLFGVAFYGADSLAGLRPERYRLYFSWEREIPYLPLAYVPYYSVLAVPFLVPFLVPTARMIRQWRNRMALAILAAGVAFLLFPAELGFDGAAPPAWDGVRQLTRIVAGRYNLVPSLHVGLTAVTLRFVWPYVGARARRALLGWAALLVASTLLTHQHHLLDVAAGLLLARAVCRKVHVD